MTEKPRKRDIGDEFVSKDLNNFMLEPWVMPETSNTTDSTSGKTST